MNGELFMERRPSGIFSPCAACGTVDLCTTAGHPRQDYRYLLRWPTGVENDWSACFVLANPSTATPFETDPTVARCINYTKHWGFGWCHVANARAWRETDPRKLPKDPIAVGALNDGYIAAAAGMAQMVICGWGKLGGTRGLVVLDVIRRTGAIPMALKLNQDGSPQHPLYLAANLRPFAMSAKATGIA